MSGGGDEHVDTDRRSRTAREGMDLRRVPDAIERALAVRDYVEAADLVVDHLVPLCTAGLRIDVGRWLTSIPVGALDDDLDLAVDHCGALLFIGRQEWVVRHGVLTDMVRVSRDDLLARLRLFEAIGWASQGWTHEWSSSVQRALRLKPFGTVEPFDEINDAWRARLLSLQDRHDEAIIVARSLVAKERRLVVDATAYSLLAGRLDEAADPSAVEIGATALELWSRLGEPNLMGMVDALCVIADHARREGDVERAEELATSALALVADVQTNYWVVRAAISLAAVEEAHGRTDEARIRLESVRERAESTRVAPLVLTHLPPLPRAGRIDGHGLLSPGSPNSSLLTDREYTILQMLQGHHTFPEIARALYISRSTVKTHVSRIYRKLGVSSRSAAVDAARHRGLVP